MIDSNSRAWKPCDRTLFSCSANAMQKLLRLLLLGIFVYPNFAVSDDVSASEVGAGEVTKQEFVVVSDKKLYTLTFVPLEKIRPRVIHSWLLKVEDSEGGKVAGAKVRFRASMPSHGHGMTTTPSINPTTTPGVFVLKGIHFNMGGTWVFDVTISSPKPDKLSLSLNVGY